MGGGVQHCTFTVYLRLLAPGTEGSVLTLLIGTLASWPSLPCSFLEQNEEPVTIHEFHTFYFIFVSMDMPQRVLAAFSILDN